MRKKTILTAFLLLTIIGLLYATTWFETEVECPLCESNNKFQQIGSYGSYIYSWESKFQYIYWPMTETYSVYSCKKCRYSAFMWDFAYISGDTLHTIKNAMDTLEIPMKANKEYEKIPVSEKLETAELFYTLYQDDPDFWCWFYRIKGYHYELENKPDKAKESRLQALSIAMELLDEKENKFRKKELLLISGAMQHFTGSDSLALIDFESAKKLKYSNPDNSKEDNQGLNDYLDQLLAEYTEMIINPAE